LNPAREGTATASLGSLGQGSTTLMEKNFFLTSNLNLPSPGLEPFPLVPSLSFQSSKVLFTRCWPACAAWRSGCATERAKGNSSVCVHRRAGRELTVRAGPRDPPGTSRCVAVAAGSWPGRTWGWDRAAVV